MNMVALGTVVLVAGSMLVVCGYLFGLEHRSSKARRTGFGARLFEGFSNDRERRRNWTDI